MSSQDVHRLGQKETRIALARLVEALQSARFYGDVRLKMKGGDLAHVILEQAVVPRDILEERLVCVVLKRESREKVSSAQKESSS
jgi:hypothetical protein